MAPSECVCGVVYRHRLELAVIHILALGPESTAPGTFRELLYIQHRGDSWKLRWPIDQSISRVSCVVGCQQRAAPPGTIRLANQPQHASTSFGSARIAPEMISSSEEQAPCHHHLHGQIVDRVIETWLGLTCAVARVQRCRFRHAAGLGISTVPTTTAATLVQGGASTITATQ